MIRSRSVFAPALLVSIGLALTMLQPASARVPNLNVKMGLWEVTTVAQTSGSLPVDLSHLTPEQQARVAAAMEMSKKHAAMPHTFRTCLTPEKMQKDLFQDKNNASCKQTVVSSSTTAYDVKYECNNGQDGNATGEWRFVAATPELVQGSGQWMIERAGHKMQSAGNMTAKWVGASCGNVK